MFNLAPGTLEKASAGFCLLAHGEIPAAKLAFGYPGISAVCCWDQSAWQAGALLSAETVFSTGFVCLRSMWDLGRYTKEKPAELCTSASTKISCLWSTGDHLPRTGLLVVEFYFFPPYGNVLHGICEKLCSSVKMERCSCSGRMN